MPAAGAPRAAEEVGWVQTLGRLQNERPEAIAAFIERVETERRRGVAQFPKLTDTAKAKLAAEFDTPGERREIYEGWLPEYQANNTGDSGDIGSAAAPGPEGAAPEQGEQGLDGTEVRADVAARIAASLRVSPGE